LFLGLCRHQLIREDDLGNLYNLLIDEHPEIRHASGALIYDHLIVQEVRLLQEHYFMIT